MENNVIMLTKEQREQLEAFIKCGIRDVHLVLRARVILRLDRSTKKEHLRISRISEELGLSRQSIYVIRNDFLKATDLATFLTRKKRETPPVPAKVTGEVEAKIIALACSKPPEGYARWTVRLLANKSVELKFLDSLSQVTVMHLLKKRNLSLI